MTSLDRVSQVVEEKSEKRKDKPALVFIQDLIKLHEDCGFGLIDKDGAILDYLHDVLKNEKSPNQTDINTLRVRLYYHYAIKLNNDLSDYAHELSTELINTDSTFSLINSCTRKLDKIERSIRLDTKETLKELSAIINSLIEEYNKLVDKEPELKNKGRQKFIKFLSPILLISSGVFVGVLQKADITLDTLTTLGSILFIYIIYIGMMFNIFKHIYHKYVK